MVEIAAKTPSRRARSLLGAPSQDLILLIRGTEHGGQVVRLSASKCTVGSRKGCTLRLRAAGVRPVHCRIFRGRRATFVRRFDDNTRLNGRLFDSAPLAVGDRLTIGPVELEVIDELAARRFARRAPTAALVRTERGDAAPLREVVEQARQQADLLRSSLAKTRHAATRRVQQLTKQLRTARERLHRLQAEFHGDRERTRCVQEALAEQQAELDRQFETRRRELEADLKSRQAELENQATEVAKQAAELAERKQQLAQDRAQRQGELEALQRQLTESRELVERQQAEAERGSADDQQTLAAEMERLEEQKRQFEADRVAWQQERQRYDDELRERTVLLERRQADLAESDQALAATRAELDTLKEELHCRQDGDATAGPQPPELPATDFASPRDETPPLPEMADTAAAPGDLLASLFPGVDAPAEADGPAETETQPVPDTSPDAVLPPPEMAPPMEYAEPAGGEMEIPSPEPTVPQTPCPSPAEAAANAGVAGPNNAPADDESDRDESVEEYMADLMKRLRGEGAPAPEEEEGPYVSPGKREIEEAAPAALPEEAAPEDPLDEPLQPSEYRPRNVAPESKTDLGALREVANTSARSAIGHHAKKRSGKGAFGKMLLACLALLAALAFNSWRPVLGYTALTGTAVSLVAAGLWTAQAARMLGGTAFARPQKSARASRRITAGRRIVRLACG